jgi:hypothetical protein
VGISALRATVQWRFVVRGPLPKKPQRWTQPLVPGQNGSGDTDYKTVESLDFYDFQQKKPAQLISFQEKTNDCTVAIRVSFRFPDKLNQILERKTLR